MFMLLNRPPELQEQVGGIYLCLYVYFAFNVTFVGAAVLSIMVSVCLVPQELGIFVFCFNTILAAACTLQKWCIWTFRPTECASLVFLTHQMPLESPHDERALATTGVPLGVANRHQDFVLSLGDCVQAMTCPIPNLFVVL